MEGSKNLMIVKRCQSTQPLLDLQFHLDDRTVQAGGLFEPQEFGQRHWLERDVSGENRWPSWQHLVCCSPRKFMLNLFGKLLQAHVEVGQKSSCVGFPGKFTLQRGHLEKAATCAMLWMCMKFSRQESFYFTSSFFSISSAFASPSLEVAVVQSIGSWGQSLLWHLAGFEFVVFGPWKRQDRFCKFISMEVGGEKWWTGGYAWEMNALQPCLHLWSEINTVRVGKMRYRCTSLPLLCPAKICTMKSGKVFHCLYLIDHYPPMVVWKRWGQPHFMENRCSIVCEVSNASQNPFCHLFRLSSDISQLPMHYWSLPHSWLTLVGRWPLSCRFLCQINFLALASSQTAWHQKRKRQLENALSSSSWLRSSAGLWHLWCQLGSNQFRECS